MIIKLNSKLSKKRYHMNRRKALEAYHMSFKNKTINYKTDWIDLSKIYFDIFIKYQAIKI